MTHIIQGEYHSETVCPPSFAHWAILIRDDISESDGYGGSSSSAVLRYHVFLTEQSWKDALLDLQQQRLAKKYGREVEFYGIHVDKVAKLNVSVEVG